MSADKSPAFRFYARDFIADENVARMGNAETGIYIRLLCFCWLEESIPADLEELALMLPRTSTKDLERAWKVVGRCFAAHPTQAGRLVQPRLDREREKQIENRDRRAAAGRIGAGQRWQSHSNRTPIEQQSQSERTPTVMRSDSLAFAFTFASAETLSRAGAKGFGDLPDVRRSALEAMPPEIALGVWFVEDGLAARVIPGHKALDPMTDAHRWREVSSKLIASHGIAEVRLRAHRMFQRGQAKGAERWRVHTMPMLAEYWDMFDGGEPSSKPGTRQIGDAERQLLADIAQ